MQNLSSGLVKAWDIIAVYKACVVVIIFLCNAVFFFCVCKLTGGAEPPKCGLQGKRWRVNKDEPMSKTELYKHVYIALEEKKHKRAFKNAYERVSLTKIG